MTFSFFGCPMRGGVWVHFDFVEPNEDARIGIDEAVCTSIDFTLRSFGDSTPYAGELPYKIPNPLTLKAVEEAVGRAFHIDEYNETKLEAVYKSAFGRVGTRRRPYKRTCYHFRPEKGVTLKVWFSDGVPWRLVVTLEDRNEAQSAVEQEPAMSRSASALSALKAVSSRASRLLFGRR